ncbi:MAG: transcriptional regulator [Cupriavidus sp.]|nr:transcriptional regulator [Cupriavidus sp.]
MEGNANWGQHPAFTGSIPTEEAHRAVPAAGVQPDLDAFLASYAGMQGNPAAPVWLCEATSRLAGSPATSSLQPVTAPVAWDRAFRQRNQDEIPKWQSHQKIARILAAAHASASDTGTPDWKDYFEKQIYGPAGSEFWLSLYPALVRPEEPTRMAQGTHPVPRTLKRYAALCRNGSRFKFVGELAQRMAPKLIVCFGQQHADDFRSAFGFDGIAGEDVILQPADLPKRLRVHTRGEMRLVIAPLLAGTDGINSDVLQIALGRYIGRLLSAGAA